MRQLQLLPYPSIGAPYKKGNTMSTSIKRALRTFFQAFIGVLLSSGILSALGENAVVDWPALKKVGLSALGAGIVAFVTWLQNFLEDKEVIPTVIPKN